MPTNAHGLEFTAGSSAAVRHYDATISAYLGLRLDTGEHMKHTFAADPDMPMAHVARGCFFKLFCTAALEGKAADAHAKARALIDGHGANARERRHLDALGAWCVGDIAGATRHWEAILVDHPRDVLALRLAHFTHFYLGDSAAMRDSVARVLPHWDASLPDYGFVLGCRAFGLEEAGQYAAAERVGRHAVACNAEDIWATHAVAHVLEMEGRAKEGIAWLEGLSDRWGACNNFAYHVWWHLCLFHLERRDVARVLNLYDTRVRADRSEDYLDMSNAIALLWRLEEAGVDVGDRWDELAEKSARKAGEAIFAFNDLHYLIALARSGRFDDADALAAGLADAASGDTTEAAVYAEVGLPLARGILALARGKAPVAMQHFGPIVRSVHRIGGSHAQRDLFFRIVVRAALEAGQARFARALLAERTALNPNSAWAWSRTADALVALGDTDGADDAAARSAALRAA